MCVCVCVCVRFFYINGRFCGPRRRCTHRFYPKIWKNLGTFLNATVSLSPVLTVPLARKGHDWAEISTTRGLESRDQWHVKQPPQPTLGKTARAPGRCGVRPRRLRRRLWAHAQQTDGLEREKNKGCRQRKGNQSEGRIKEGEGRASPADHPASRALKIVLGERNNNVQLVHTEQVDGFPLEKRLHIKTAKIFAARPASAPLGALVLGESLQIRSPLRR